VLPLAELADANAVYGYSFIVTNLDVSTPDNAAAVEHWYRHRTQIENIFKDAKHGASRSTPAIRVSAGQHRVDVGGAARGHHRWPAAPTHRHPDRQRPAGGHGVRHGQAVIATLRHKLIRVPARLVHHAGALTLRLSPGHDLLEAVLARIRALPTTS
jgi:hypothetical protein